MWQNKGKTSVFVMNFTVIYALGRKHRCKCTEGNRLKELICHPLNSMASFGMCAQKKGGNKAECMYLIFSCFVEEFNSWPFGYLSSALTNPTGVIFCGRTNWPCLFDLLGLDARVMKLLWWIRAAWNEMHLQMRCSVSIWVFQVFHLIKVH